MVAPVSEASSACPWGAWYGAPIAVVASNLGYTLVWHIAESFEGVSSGWNDVVLATQVGAKNIWSVEAAAPPMLPATGREPPGTRPPRPSAGCASIAWVSSRRVAAAAARVRR